MSMISFFGTSTSMAYQSMRNSNNRSNELARRRWDHSRSRTSTSVSKVNKTSKCIEDELDESGETYQMENQ